MNEILEIINQFVIYHIEIAAVIIDPLIAVMVYKTNVVPFANTTDGGCMYETGSISLATVAVLKLKPTHCLCDRHNYPHSFIDVTVMTPSMLAVGFSCTLL